MEIKRSGTPYEITDEPALVGAIRVAMPIEGTPDNSWQSAFLNHLRAAFTSMAQEVDGQTAGQPEFRDGLIVLKVRSRDVAQLQPLLSAAAEAIDAANSFTTDAEKTAEQAAAESARKQSAMRAQINEELTAWDNANPPS